MKKKQLNTVAAMAAIGSGFVAVHGITSKRWKNAHTVFAGIALAVAVISFVQDAT